MSFLLIRKAVDWGFMDAPDARKVHTQPTPRTGGLAMVLGGGLTFGLATYLSWLPWPVLPWQTWLAGCGFITVGALDDRFSFNPRQKVPVLLALSALAAWPWVTALQITNIPWLPSSPVAHIWILILGTLLLTFWFMAVPNAVNIEDAINGYMGGYTFIVLFALYLRGVDSLLALGALVGFMLLNWPKATHFMGDAGSFGCGFFIAEGVLRAGGLNHPIMAIVMTAPISMDVAMGLIRRHSLGVSFFTADRSTCPHHLLDLTGGKPLLATPLLWLNALVFALVADHPWLTLIQAGFYATALVVMNRKLIFTKATLTQG